MGKSDEYESSYLRKVKNKRAPDDLFVPQGTGSLSKLGVPILILLLLAVIAYLLMRGNSEVVQNSSVSKPSISMYNDAPQKVSKDSEEVKKADETSSPAVIEMDETVDSAKKVPDGSSEKMLKITQESLKNVNTNGAKMSDEDLAKIAQMVVSQLQKTKESNSDLAQALGDAETDTLSDATVASNANAPKSTSKISHYNKVMLGDNESKTEGQLSALYSKTSGSKKKTAYIESTARELSSRTKEMRYHTVRQGETLSGIALAIYGNVKYFTKIYEANPDILRSAHAIYVGQKLRIPE